MRLKIFYCWNPLTHPWVERLSAGAMCGTAMILVPPAPGDA
jgi:hypothetical protein